MLDLRVLRDHWTEDGARAVFAEIVNQCVNATYSGARTIRPDPGDEGIDTFVGEFDQHLKVYQAKFFCDKIGTSQQAQIRKSWKACVDSSYFKRVVLWTLCIPIELSIDETRWWQKWRKDQMKASGRVIELWSKGDFVRFFAKAELERIFAIALRRGHEHPSADAALHAMRTARTLNLQTLPRPDHLRSAIFVRKLERAGVHQHRSARMAFYNFEFLRSYVEQGGDPKEVAALEDLQERIFELWELAFTEHDQEQLGRPLYAKVMHLIEEHHDRRLRSALPAQVAHKRGGLHYWADSCQAGWTPGFESVADEEGSV